MACLLKAPDGERRGCVTLTTPERDLLISPNPQLRTIVEMLKSRYVLGLHHNWHDFTFKYDDLFDFSMAGDGDLIEQDGRPFVHVPIDACNFVPPFFSTSSPRTPFWDVFNVGRAVDFKGIPQFLAAMRQVYDRGVSPRVLFLCSIGTGEKLTGVDDLRLHFERLFSPEERHRFTLMTMDWDYPFPLDLETLAFFYKSSRVFVHPAADERRCRTAAYAWASGIPVVGRNNVASILPPQFRKPPYYFGYEQDEGLADALMRALNDDSYCEMWRDVAAEFESAPSIERLEGFLQTQDWHVSTQPISPTALDIRLGRHHRLSAGRNRVDHDLGEFCQYLLNGSDADIAVLCASTDPELAIATLDGKNVEIPGRTRARGFFRRLLLGRAIGAGEG
jgi:glycosyltransferase involved in cell wall biosynthesis